MSLPSLARCSPQASVGTIFDGHLKILVIGGSENADKRIRKQLGGACVEIVVIGNHERSDYGSEHHWSLVSDVDANSWQTKQYWLDATQWITRMNYGHQFDVILIDLGSDSWLPNLDELGVFMEACLSPTGFIALDNKQMFMIRNSLRVLIERQVVPQHFYPIDTANFEEMVFIWTRKDALPPIKMIRGGYDVLVYIRSGSRKFMFQSDVRVYGEGLRMRINIFMISKAIKEIPRQQGVFVKPYELDVFDKYYEWEQNDIAKEYKANGGIVGVVRALLAESRLPGV